MIDGVACFCYVSESETKTATASASVDDFYARASTTENANVHVDAPAPVTTTTNVTAIVSVPAVLSAHDHETETENEHVETILDHGFSNATKRRRDVVANRNDDDENVAKIETMNGSVLEVTASFVLETLIAIDSLFEQSTLVLTKSRRPLSSPRQTKTALGHRVHHVARLLQCPETVCPL